MRSFRKLDRRKFWKIVAFSATVYALKKAPGAQRNQAKLALHGGKPVRKSLLRARPFGPQFYGEEEKKQLLQVIQSKSPFRWWGFGPKRPQKVLQFEREYAQYVGTKYALGVTSGTAALMTAMAALEVGPGDEVILPAWTWYACYDAIVLAGALPVFAEIDESFNIDPEDIERKITPRTKVIMPVHLQGTPCDMDRVLAIARKHNLKVLEDCAQCVGGRYKGKPVGSFGDIGIYSFQLNKTITSGEGGALVTNDPILFERALRFHDVGVIRSPYTQILKGGRLASFASPNFRMSEFTAAVLIAQLHKLESICKALRANFKAVRESLADLPNVRFRATPDLEGDLGVAVFLDMKTREKRNLFLRALWAENIAASPPSGSAILPIDPRIKTKATVHPQWPSFTSKRGREIRYGKACCPRTIDILGRYGGVGLDPCFSASDLSDIVKAIRKVYSALKVS